MLLCNFFVFATFLLIRLRTFQEIQAVVFSAIYIQLQQKQKKRCIFCSQDLKYRRRSTFKVEK